jgi:hypothetical protein
MTISVATVARQSQLLQLLNSHSYIVADNHTCLVISDSCDGIHLTDGYAVDQYIEDLGGAPHRLLCGCYVCGKKVSCGCVYAVLAVWLSAACQAGAECRGHRSCRSAGCGAHDGLLLQMVQVVLGRVCGLDNMVVLQIVFCSFYTDYFAYGAEEDVCRCRELFLCVERV